MFRLRLFAFYVCLVFVVDAVVAGRDELQADRRIRQPSVANRNWQLQALSQQQPKSPSVGIPIEMALKLSTITDVHEFEKYVDGDLQLPRQMISGNVDDKVRQSRVAGLHNIRSPTRYPDEAQIGIASFGKAFDNSNDRIVEDGGAVTTRFGSSDSTTNESTVIEAKPAICQPELRTVSVRDTSDLTLVYYPSCIRVDRCGGCCMHELLSCQPTAVAYKNYSVSVTEYKGNEKLKSKSTKIITVEHHTKCKCDCRIKEKDCTPSQQYVKKDCRCVCKNKSEESTCLQDSNKLWSPTTCSCGCRTVQECSTGSYFDENECKCVKKITQPNYVTNNRYTYV